MMKQDVFDLSHFDEYMEGNRLEVKRQAAVCLIAFGTHIHPFPIAMAELSFLE